MNEPTHIEMFLDISCPWCHGALETNRRLLDELAADPAAPSIEVHWRFMRLGELQHPGQPVEEYLGGYVDGDLAKVRELRDGVQEFVTSVGVRVDEARYVRIWDPLLPHRLLAAVRDDGGDDLPHLWSLARVIFSANFVQGVELSDLAALRGGIERGGLTLPHRIWQLLSSDDGHLTETLADRERALEIELDGVPRMYVNGRIVPTWIDPTEVRRQLCDALGLPA